MYCFGGNHRYSLFEDFWETLGATIGAILGATLDANFGRKKSFKKSFFWDSNPGQIDDFYLMRLFCLSIYIRNITYLTTVIQRIKKIDTELLLFIQMDRSLFWLRVLTESVNLVSGISHTARYTNSGNQTGKPACVFSRSSYPV